MNREPANIVLRPLMTEKGTKIQEIANQFFFEVRRDANKTEIKRAVEKLFQVKVTGVNTLIVPGETKRRGLHRYKTKSYKKAIVTLREGDSIELFEGV